MVNPLCLAVMEGVENIAPSIHYMNSIYIVFLQYVCRVLLATVIQRFDLASLTHHFLVTLTRLSRGYQ